MENTQWEYCRKVISEDGRECIEDKCIEDKCIETKRVIQTEEILDFANMVFSVAYSSTDFAALLPKAYSRERSGSLIHHMILEENKIRALIDIYPLGLHLQGEQRALDAAYVGTVAVHPNSRGRGYMIELMKRAEEDARRQGCALMILDGGRHRYQHYGFERAGMRVIFQIETENITHCCKRLYPGEAMDRPAFCFEEVMQDSSYIEQMYTLYQQRLVTARSRKDFWWCLQSYNASVYVVLRDHEVVGYVNLSETRESVLEFAIVEGAIENRDICRVLYDLMMQFDTEQIRVSVGMDEQDKIAALELACDSCSIAMSHQIKILNYEAVLYFLLKWKQRYAFLASGDYVLGIRDEQTGSIEKYLLSVAEDNIRVLRTEIAADIVLEKMEMVRLLTTNLYYAQQQKGVQGKIKNAPAGWFPLPFYLPEADTF